LDSGANAKARRLPVGPFGFLELGGDGERRLLVAGEERGPGAGQLPIDVRPFVGRRVMAERRSARGGDRGCSRRAAAREILDGEEGEPDGRDVLPEYPPRREGRSPRDESRDEACELQARAL